ncbi:MAG TPA: asparaginase domain-containing protein [Terracidiphilus sp.]|jgi:L-asparaginase
MQTIYLITTGGTIEKEYSEQMGVVVNNRSKIGDYLKRLRLSDCRVEVIALMNKDSLEMTPQDRAALVAEIAQLLPTRRPVVITHGTDTMVESGHEIEKSLSGLRVPIVLTGAMKPLGFDRSDGLQNLTEGLFATRLLDPGVYVVFHGQVIPVSKARKDRALGTFVRVNSESEFQEATAEV